MQTVVYDLKEQYRQGIAAAAEVIRTGGLVALPTETVYGLGADAQNEVAVRQIFAVKGRPQDNPLIVHLCDAAQVDELAANVSPLARRVMQAFWPGPFTAVVRVKPGALPAVTTAGLATVGLRMPSHPAARDLIAQSGRLIAAPSANLSGKPSPTCLAHVRQDLWGKVPVILDGGPCAVGLESTVCDLTGEVPVVLRPGGVSPEMIAAVAGDARVAHAVLHELGEGEAAPSPGMKYKHYAPRAKVTVVQSDDRNRLANHINSLYDKGIASGERALVLCLRAHMPLYGGREILCLGETPEDAARTLFGALRQADARGVNAVFFEALSAEGIGLAVMNRVIRAAGFDLVRV